MEERDCPVWTGQQVPGRETWSVRLLCIWGGQTIRHHQLCQGSLEQWLCHVPPAAAGGVKENRGSSGGWSCPLEGVPVECD